MKLECILQLLQKERSESEHVEIMMCFLCCVFMGMLAHDTDMHDT
jgi:hypothetical protein